jgi:hypothetical protein
MLFQLKLNKVTPFSTYSNYSVKILLDKNFLNTSKLKRRGIFTKDLSYITVQPIIEHNNASL